MISFFGVRDRAIDAEIHADDNQEPKGLKHTDDSTITQDVDDMNSSTTSTMNKESIQDIPNAQVEGERLSSHNSVEGEHTIEGDQHQMDVNVEREHPTNDPIVFGGAKWVFTKYFEYSH